MSVKRPIAETLFSPRKENKKTKMMDLAEAEATLVTEPYTKMLTEQATTLQSMVSFVEDLLKRNRHGEGPQGPPEAAAH